MPRETGCAATGRRSKAETIGCGNTHSQAADMVALGAVVKATGMIPLEPIKSAVAKMLSHKDSVETMALNELALDPGYNSV